MRALMIASVLAGCGPIEPDVSSGPMESFTVLEEREQAARPAIPRRSKPPQALAWRFGPEQESIYAWSERAVHVIPLASPEDAMVVEGLWTGVEDVLFSPDGKRVAIVLHDGLEVRDADTWVLRGSIESELTDGLVTLSSGGHVVALTRWSTETANNRTEVWRVHDGVRLSRWDEGYSQLVFMPGDHRVAGVTMFWETISARDIGSGDELWRYTGSSGECALESPITISPRGTHFAYTACGHALHTQKIGAKDRPAIALADGCAERHVYVNGYDPGGLTFVGGNAYWNARFDARTGATLERWDVEEAPWPPPAPVFTTRDGRFEVDATSIRNVLTAEVYGLPFDLVVEPQGL